MRRAALCVAALGFAFPLFQRSAEAAIPQVISFQGKLADAAGAASGDAVDIVFGLYDAATGGASVWAETLSVDPDANGRFAVVLGATTTFSSQGVDFTAPLWLGVTVGADAEMTPRFQLATAPYAMRAETAAAADNVDWADVANVPADIADGDADTIYTQGTGIQISGTTVNADVGTGAGQVAAGGHTHDLDGLGDVTVTAVTDDEVLAYDNTSGEWINQTAAEAGLAAAAHAHDAAYVNDGAGEVNAANDFNFTSSTHVANLDADTVDDEGRHALGSRIRCRRRGERQDLRVRG